MPVSVTKGVGAVAQLFVGTRDSVWHHLDAGTGVEIESWPFTGLVHGTVVLDDRILVSTRSAAVGTGNGQLASFRCTVPCPTGLVGDITCDGNLDLADVVFLGNYLDGLVTFTPPCVGCADLDDNGEIDENDYFSLFDLLATLDVPARD